MARVRSINPGFFLDDELAELPPLTRILFAGLWCVADREGRLKDRPRRIKPETLPYDDVDMDAQLSELAARGFIYRYEAGGRRYIAIPSWHRYQNPHHKEAQSMIPPPKGRAWTMLESSTGQAWSKLARSSSHSSSHSSRSVSQQKDKTPCPKCEADLTYDDRQRATCPMCDWKEAAP